MRQGHFEQHWTDEHGNPSGGVSTGRGFTISWQRGGLRQDGDLESRKPNGAFVEDVLQAVIGRIEFYQQSPFRCQENAEALDCLRHAAELLDQRTKAREARGVEGTHTP